MIAGGFERALHVFKYLVLRILHLYRTRLAVPDLAGVDDLAPKGMDYSLVPEADAEYRRFRPHLPDDIGADAKVLAVGRVAGARGYHYPVGVHLFDIFKRYLVVPYHYRLGAKLAEYL